MLLITKSVASSAIDSIHSFMPGFFALLSAAVLSVSSDFKRREEGRQPVLVFTDRDRSMGLMVDEILDIVEEKLAA